MASLGIHHLGIGSAADVQETFRLLGYDVDDLYVYEGDDLDQFDFDPVDRDAVKRIYIIGERDRHTVYLFEVDDLRLTRLRGLAWNLLQRGGTGLLVITRDYREVLFVDPRFVGNPTKSNVRVNKLKMVTSDPTRHDLDTLNAIHAHRRSGQQVYAAQAEAFNVNTITKRFYDEYREHYEHARELIQHYNPGIREFYDADKLHAFTQRLLGRLMFLYFLQRKGWLGGRQKFLTEQYHETRRRHADELNDGETFYYYREVLEPLFFDTLNRKRPDNITQWGNYRIPYLNGGLFDRDRDPDGMIVLPDALFDPNSSEGILAFFNRYNFTIADDTPLEQDVAVDPEMLGKVFENLLEERDRGQSGSFYTPRAIVSYMCQEALAGYLEESAGVSRELVRAQFDPDNEQQFSPEEAERVNQALDTLTVLDPAVGSGSFLIGMMAEIIRLRTACYQVLTPRPQGEGQGVRAEFIADWKERIIRDTLYGVDIKPEAIEIAQLRLWLALVVDQTLEQARPLPNLDYRLMAGNSLIETIDGQPVLGELATRMLQTQAGTAEWEQVNNQLKMFDPNPVQARMVLFESDKEALNLPQLRERFFRATPDERKTLRDEIAAQERRIVFASLHERAEALQQTIDQIGKKAAQTGGKLKPSDTKKLQDASDRLKRIHDAETELKKPDGYRPFFLHHLHFSEVFTAKGGFDIVIANPPYVRGEAIDPAIKQELEFTYAKVYAGAVDLYVYFYARGFNLLRPGGQLSFITSNKYLRAKYGEGLRRFLSSRVKIYAIIDFGDLPVFDVAAYPCIVIGSNQIQIGNNVKAFAVANVDYLESLPRLVETRSVIFDQNRLSNTEWQISEGNTQRVLEKIRNQNPTLEQLIGSNFYRGIVTGANDVFVLDETTKNQLVSQDPNSSELIHPWLRGRDIKRWKIDWNNLYVIFTRRGTNIDKYPAIKMYLQRFREDLEPKESKNQSRGRKPGSYQWFEIQDNIAYYLEFSKPKIIYPDIAPRPQFSLDKESGFYSGNTTYFIPSADEYLLGFLNSKAVEFFYSSVSPQIRGGYYRFFSQYVGLIPIPNTLPNIRNQIADLALLCLDVAKDAPEQLPAFEARLNALVYQAYGLDESDIAVIEGYLGGEKPTLDDNMLNEPEE
jgi:Eco57I restriction-modification methylase/TaqI-like C-terminal specificity domain